MNSTFSRYQRPLRLLLPFFFSLYLLNGVPGGRMESRAQPGSTADAEFFRSQILPLLAKRCQSCHNDTLKLSGLTLETRSGFLNGGWHGPVVTSGKPDDSRLFRRVARLEKLYMPLGPGGGAGEPLPQEEVAIIKQWIEDGAEWPPDPNAEEA